MTATVIRLPNHRARFASRPMTHQASEALRAELRRARVRITQLEASLAEALRDNLEHFERAREAERQLAALLGAEGGADGPSGTDPD